MTKLHQSKFTIIIANEHHFCEKSYKKVTKKLLPVRQVLTGKSFSPYVVYINLL